MNKNEIVGFIDKIAMKYQSLGDNRKFSAFDKAAKSISLHAKDIVEDIGSLAEYPGVGSSTLKEIEQFVATGTSDREKALDIEIASDSNKRAESNKEENKNKVSSILDKIKAAKQ